MTDQLPPLPHDDDAETTQTDPQRTMRSHTRPPVSSSSTQPLRPTRIQPQVPGSGHVQQNRATATQPQVRRPVTSLPAYTRPVTRKPDPRRDSGLYLPWWSLVGMLMGVLAASFAVVMLIVALGNTVLPATREPVIRIITAVPTQPGSTSQNSQPVQQPGSQTLSGANPPAELSLQGPTLPAVVFTPTPQPITIGSTVVVTGVGADELNVRDKAGVLGTNILFRTKDGSVFTVIEGPMQADGFTWWRIQDITNTSLNGWAVANYLRIVEGQ